MRAHRAVLAVVVALTVGGCSLVSFIYDRLDTIVVAYADEWFDFDRAQARRFKERVRARLAEHRREELPGYSAFLGEAARLVQGRPAPAEIDALLDRGRLLFEDGLRRSLPLMSETLAELTPAQVEHLTEQIAEANEDYREELLELDPKERAADRRRELQREIERWTGRLDAPQRAILDGLVARIPDGAQAWYDHRRVRQRGLLALLRSRADASAHAAYIEEWWLGARHLDAAHAAQLARNRERTVEALAELIATLTPRQRERATSRLRAIASELDALHRQGLTQAAGKSG